MSGSDDYANFSAEHRRTISGGEVSFWRKTDTSGMVASRESSASQARVQTWRPFGGGGCIEITLDDAGKALLKRIEHALSDAFEAGQRAQQKAVLLVLGVKQ